MVVSNIYLAALFYTLRTFILHFILHFTLYVLYINI